MKKYTVTLEFNVSSIDFGDVKVEANSKEEAIKKAIESYYDGTDVDYYQSDYYESELIEDESKNFKVKEE